ncbi:MULTISPECIES: hypothetical protein [unclassified Sphingomonas]|uniref:hypothetical protein n=1 Tax=unclassified Sphingomonas TaxID=196159 RepID=UPI0006F8F440|nr:MULTISPECIES: hypothetical protein [unclassified Sphingomonas]KQX25718.1 hypothetical protein ASD17_22255 [Sphingomonas sp. Root1294]KQY66707.1 hypothetical protein ASD39_12055 [Sphingomonas sp. Root50]KRB90184.1 hypothetical protein ASE22_14895 [Sphingomonas sp. Root720]
MRLAASTTAGLTAAAIAASAILPLSDVRAQRLPMSPEQSRRASRAFVTCTVDRRREIATHYLAATDATDFAKWRDRLFDNVRCGMKDFPTVASGFRMTYIPVDVERGFVAEQLIAVGRVALVAEPEPIGTFDGRWSGVSGRAPAVDEMAGCAASVRPADLIALLRTEPDSEAEKTAFAGLGDLFGQCLVTGAKLQANRLSLRAALAEALYRRAARQAPISTAGTQ